MCPVFVYSIHEEKKYFSGKMNIKELEAVLDIVNREIKEESELGDYFSMDNPEKQEWIKRLRNRGILLTDTTKTQQDPKKLKSWIGEGDRFVWRDGRKVLERGAACL